MANVKKLIRDTYRLEQQMEEIKTKATQNRQDIQAYFDKEEVKILEVPLTENAKDTENIIVATKSEKVYIDYDMVKLQSRLKKDIFSEIAIKEYAITDINGLIELLKKAKIKPNEFKQFIDVKISPNKEAIKQLYEVGDITKKDLDGCYNAKIVKSIQIKERKGGTN